MPSKELQHLRRAVEAAAKLVKKPVLEYQQPEAEQSPRPQPEPQRGA